MARVSTTIANEVRRIRQERGMSAQRLSDRCAELGAPIPRTVLSNLENGRRGNVTVAEMLVLAAALDVPPATLVFPVGHQVTVEALPGKLQPALSAIEWLAAGTETGDAASREMVPLYRFKNQKRKVKALAALLTQVAWESKELTRGELAEAAVRLEVAKRDVEIMREKAARLSVELSHASAHPEASSEANRLAAEQAAVHESLYRAEAVLVEAKELEKMASMRAALAGSHRREAEEVIEQIRADRKDMEQRGWTLPELPGTVALALEKGIPAVTG